MSTLCDTLRLFAKTHAFQNLMYLAYSTNSQNFHVYSSYHNFWPDSDMVWCTKVSKVS